MEKLDARGLSCPEPVIMLNQAINTGATELEMVVGNNTARENVTRFAESKGYAVAVEENDGEYQLHITK